MAGASKGKARSVEAPQGDQGVIQQVRSIEKIGSQFVGLGELCGGEATTVHKPALRTERAQSQKFSPRSEKENFLRYPLKWEKTVKDLILGIHRKKERYVKRKRETIRGKGLKYKRWSGDKVTRDLGCCQEENQL